MCGICGIIGNHPDLAKLVTAMGDMLSHRGPEKFGIYQHENVCLGHRRLSIIDLFTGDQPIFNEDRSVVVVYNGEIYNFKDIKKTLIAKGHRFSTASDTEILVHGYEEFGLNFLSELNGIFAFALYDLHKNRLILVRDQFGIKPLHYWFDGKTLVFASEQKAILLHPDVPRYLNYSALHCQINLRFNQGNETLFKDIYRLPPAHYLIYENNRLTIERYYHLPVNINYSLTEGEAIEMIRTHLKTAVRRQLLSDVPIGVYLSGGMDSSSLVAIMSQLNVSPINTFTMGFNEDTDEFPDAGQIAGHFHTNHQTTSLSFEPLQQYPQVIWHAEEPKINLLQGFNMSRFVSSGYKVVLGGLGGDELFMGYDIYKYIRQVTWLLDHVAPKFQHTVLEPFSQSLFILQNRSRTLRYDEYRRGLQMVLSIGNLNKFYLILRNCWDYDRSFYKEIYHPGFATDSIQPVHNYFDPLFTQVSDLSAADAVSVVEFYSKMVNDYLLVDDRMSMAHSVELRVPFLDKDLVEYMFTIPAGLKMKNQVTKYLFRKAMQPYLPARIIKKKKWGFTVNPYEQFKKDLKKTAQTILTREFIERQGIFNYDYIRRIIDYPPHPRLRWHYNFLWIVVGIAIWEKMFIDTINFKKKELSLSDYL
jgi:asparagine synthase (glutamine-hydrolysing)